MPIINYNDPVDITWNTDTNGNKVSVLRPQETHKIVNYKITLGQIPDSLKLILITGYTEVKDPRISLSATNFRVDYSNGDVFFHTSKEGQSVIVTSYYGRGILKYPAGRIYLKDENDLYHANNVEDFATETTQRINNIVSGASPISGEVVDARLSGFDGTLYTVLKNRLDDMQNADKIGVADAGGYYGANPTVESALQMLGTKSQHSIDISDFGAIGDGLTSDSLAFENAINYAITKEYPIISLQPNKQYLLKSTDVSLYNGVSIIGNGATIILDGVVQFNLSNLSSFICHDLIIKTNYGLTEDSTYATNYIFYFSSNPTSVLYDIQNIYVECTASQSPKISRYPAVFALTSTHISGSKIKNIGFKNIAFGIWLNSGEGAEISNIYGYNCETLVYLRNVDSIYVYNIAIKNTYAQSITWIGKNNGIASNGKDTLQTEGGNDVKIHNIYGEFCIERVIYCQSNNVKADNIYIKDCAGVKFCGSNYANRANTIVANNIYKIVTDDILTVDTITLFDILQIYYITNVNIDGIKLVNFRSDKLTQTGLYVISMSDHTHSVRLTNIDCEYNSDQALVFFFVLQDSTKTSSNIEIENFTIRNYGNSAGEYYIYRFSPDVPVSWLNGLNIHDGKVIQNDAQILADNIIRRNYDILSKKATNIIIQNVDCGYIGYINSAQETPSTFVSDNILKLEENHKNIILASDNNYAFYYYSGYASGAGTLYFPKAKITMVGYNYKPHSTFNNTLKIIWENNSSSAIRLYDSVKELEFNMLMDSTFNNWDLPLDVIGKYYLVEVESITGCGKAIFNGSSVTEIYKTGNLVFDSTSSKLRIRPMAGASTDYYININNTILATNRVKVNVTLLNVL